MEWSDRKRKDRHVHSLPALIANIATLMASLYLMLFAACCIISCTAQARHPGHALQGLAAQAQRLAQSHAALTMASISIMADALGILWAGGRGIIDPLIAVLVCACTACIVYRKRISHTLARKPPHADTENPIHA